MTEEVTTTEIRIPKITERISRFSRADSRVVKVYPLYEPWAYAVIVENIKTGEYVYNVDEIAMNEEELNIYKRVIDYLIWRLEPPKPGVDYRAHFMEKAKEAVRTFQIKLGRTPTVSWGKIMYFVERDIIGFGPIDPLMRDPAIEDISCNGPGKPIYVWHREFESIPTNLVFRNESEIDELILKLAHMAGKHISVAYPILDAILPGGHRLAATFQKEVSTAGSTFTIRKFREDPITIIDMILYGTVSPELAAYFWLAMDYKAVTLVMGVTGSGKTSTLNALLNLTRPHYKIVTIEDTPELRLPHENWVQLVSRPSYSVTGTTGEISLFHLVKLSLRYRPDIIVVGEVRGEEAYVLFQAIASVSHDTPVLIMNSKGEVNLVNIGEFIDKFYSEDEEWVPKSIDGYYVLSHDGYNAVWKPIKYVLRHKADEIYEVTFEGGGKIKATGSHSVFVLDDESLEIIEKPVSTLKPGDLLITFVKNIPSEIVTEYQVIDVIEIVGDPKKDYVDNVPKEIKELYGGKNPIPLSTYLLLEKGKEVRKKVRLRRGRGKVLPGVIKLDEDLAFVFGAYIADGCVKEHRGKRLCFTFGKSEKDIAKEVLEVMGSKFGIEPVIDDRGTYVIYEYSHTLLAELFERLLGANLHEKHIPPQLWKSPRTVIKAFFEGLKADSRRTLRRRYTCYTTANERLAYELLWLARIAGYYSELIIEKGTGKSKGRKYYNVLVYLDADYRKPNIHERVPVKLLLRLIELTKPKSMPFELTYITKRKYVSKRTALKVLKWVRAKGSFTSQSIEYLRRLEELMNGELVVVEVKNIKRTPYQEYVYDISVPGTESFFGGNVPLLLHNTGHGGCTTIHAENIDAAVKRLTSPPMNIPPGYIPLINLGMVIKRVHIMTKEGRLRPARRITNIWEIEDYDKYVEIGRWDPIRDRFELNLSKSIFLKLISEQAGRSVPELIEEIGRRKSVLQWLAVKGIRNYRNVAQYIQSYYANPEQVLRRIREEVVKYAEEFRRKE